MDQFSFSDRRGPRVPWLPPLLFALIAAALYAPVLGGEFLKWDDQINVIANPALRAGDWVHFWTQPYYGFYIPLTYTLWTALGAIGDAPQNICFHGLNLGLHVLNATLLYRLMRAWIGDFDLSWSWPAFLGALLFLVHPLQAAAVAWISGARDLLSASLALVALLSYVRAKKWTKIASLCFGLALLAKPSIAALPLAVLVVDVLWGRVSVRRSLTSIGPALAPLLPIFWVTRVAQSGQERALNDLPWWERVLTAVDALGFYVTKILWPRALALDYGRVPALVIERRLYLGTGLALVLAGATIGFFVKRGSGTALFAAALFVAALLPVSGLVPFTYQAVSTVADHYAYFALVGVSLGLAQLLHRFPRSSYRILASIGLLGLGALSSARAHYWRTDAAFFAEMLARNPTSYSAYTNLGNIELAEGNLTAAEDLHRKALALRPWSAPALVNVLSSLVKQKRYADVIGEVIAHDADLDFTSRNARLEPEALSTLHYYRGYAEVQFGRREDALASFCRALTLLARGSRSAGDIRVQLEGLGDLARLRVGSEGCRERAN